MVLQCLSDGRKFYSQGRGGLSRNNLKRHLLRDYPVLLNLLNLVDLFILNE